MVAKISDRIAVCEKSHRGKCQIERQSKLPARVIDLRGCNENKIRLFEPGDIEGSYIALSYCWGVDSRVISTTTSNIKDHLQGIPWSSLPVLVCTWSIICHAPNAHIFRVILIGVVSVPRYNFNLLGIENTLFMDRWTLHSARFCVWLGDWISKHGHDIFQILSHNRSLILFKPQWEFVQTQVD